MAQKTRFRKRPCRICGKWFMPNPRLGDRQKTCGADACKRQWHTVKCAEWNRQNRAYFKEIYLRSRLEAASSYTAESSSPSPSPISLVRAPSPLHIPQEVVQEVMGAQQAVIIEYIVRLLLRDLENTKIPYIMSSSPGKRGHMDEDIDSKSKGCIVRHGSSHLPFGLTGTMA